MKGLFSDSNNIILWHESEWGGEAYFQNFSWFQCQVYKLCMILCAVIALHVLNYKFKPSPLNNNYYCVSGCSLLVDRIIHED